MDTNKYAPYAAAPISARTGPIGEKATSEENAVGAAAINAAPTTVPVTNINVDALNLSCRNITEKIKTQMGLVETRVTLIATDVYSRETIQERNNKAWKKPATAARQTCCRVIFLNSSRCRVTTIDDIKIDATSKRPNAINTEGEPVSWAKRVNIDAVDNPSAPMNKIRTGNGIVIVGIFVGSTGCDNGRSEFISFPFGRLPADQLHGSVDIFGS